MHFSWYEDHKNKKVQKIISILGKNWFKDKSILELGSCYGDIGIEFVKLGAQVLFTDVRQENLDKIKIKLSNPKTQIINQNANYNLKQKFDLVLHLGTLWHVENWYNDLYHALKHTSLMILETRVVPKKGSISLLGIYADAPYDGYKCFEPLFTCEVLESRLKELNCSFTRYDDSDLNTFHKDLNHIYDWKDEVINDNGNVAHYRRFYVVSKNI